MRFVKEAGISISSKFKLINHKPKAICEENEIISIIQNILLIPDNSKKMQIYPAYIEFPAEMLRPYNIIKHNRDSKDKFYKHLAIKDGIYYIRGTVISQHSERVPTILHHLNKWIETIEWSFAEDLVQIICISELYESKEEYLASIREEVIPIMTNEIFPEQGNIEVVYEEEQFEDIESNIEEDSFKKVIEESTLEDDSEEFGEFPT